MVLSDYEFIEWIFLQGNIFKNMYYYSCLIPTSIE